MRVLNAPTSASKLEEAHPGGCAADATGTPYPGSDAQKLAQAADAVLLRRRRRPEVGRCRARIAPGGLLGIRRR